jgi:hypothetical protein
MGVVGLHNAFMKVSGKALGRPAEEGESPVCENLIELAVS